MKIKLLKSQLSKKEVDDDSRLSVDTPPSYK